MIDTIPYFVAFSFGIPWIGLAIIGEVLASLTRKRFPTIGKALDTPGVRNMRYLAFFLGRESSLLLRDDRLLLNLRRIFILLLVLSVAVPLTLCVTIVICWQCGFFR